MSSLSCCFWWFLLGALVGWLAHWLLCKCCKSKPVLLENNFSAPPLEASSTTTSVISTVPEKVSTPAKTPAKPKAVKIDLAAAKAAGFKIKGVNDLTIIEGVGPKINALFNDAGLKTFIQVSGTTVKQMRTILDNGGARFRIANPSTWAKQAKLAANNKWDQLKKLQDELSGGIKK